MAKKGMTQEQAQLHNTIMGIGNAMEEHCRRVNNIAQLLQFGAKYLTADQVYEILEDAFNQNLENANFVSDYKFDIFERFIRPGLETGL